MHGSCVALDGRGLLILGRSGQGKSALALALMSQGAGLVADDRVVLTRRDGQVFADAPAALRGLIEARGVGLLHAAHVGPVLVDLVTDLDQLESERLPQSRHTDLLGHALPLLRRVDAPHFAWALLQFLKAGRQDSD